MKSLGTPRFVKHQCTKLIFKNIDLFQFCFMYACYRRTPLKLSCWIGLTNSSFFKSVYSVQEINLLYEWLTSSFLGKIYCDRKKYFDKEKMTHFTFKFGLF